MKKLKVTDFNLDHTLSCGQVFRWHKNNNGFWYGFVCGKITKIKQSGTYLYFDGNANASDIKAYFNLNINFRKMVKTFPKDKTLSQAVKKFWGLRIIKQDPFECLITYILSSQNNIPRINKMVNEMSKRFGKKYIFDGRAYFTFPKLNDLKSCCQKDLNACKLGFRDKYVEDAVTKLWNNDLTLKNIATMPYDQAKLQLMRIHGVGPKVADCVLLFAFCKFEAFPVDVWIEKAMAKYYPGKDKTYFGSYAGYAQEFLYAFIRS